jgi:hypothetical protein
MKSFEIIKDSVEHVQSSFGQKSDVYNGKRVVIKNEKYRGILSVWIKGFQIKEFKLDVDPLEVANYIQENTIN